MVVEMPRVTRARLWFFSAASMIMTVIGPILGAFLAWHLFESGTQCRDGWPELVAVSYLVLIIPSAISVVLAHVGLHRARAGNRASPAPGTGIVAVVLAWCVLVLVAGVAGVFALLMILFTNGLSC